MKFEKGYIGRNPVKAVMFRGGSIGSEEPPIIPENALKTFEDNELINTFENNELITVED